MYERTEDSRRGNGRLARIFSDLVLRLLASDRENIKAA